MRLLIIEDNNKLLHVLKRSLEKEGYAVDGVEDGEAGLKRIELYRNEYDVAIIDWMLPKKSGTDICKAMRQAGIGIPVLMLTGRDTTEDKVAGLESGADDYLTKPFSSEELHARIKALVRRPRKAFPDRLSAGDLILDPVTHKVFRGGKEVTLTLKEFCVLEYFMRHPNAVLNREQILDNNWDFEKSGFSNVVDVHVSHLRKKINKRKEAEILETVRGVGYRLLSPTQNV